MGPAALKSPAMLRQFHKMHGLGNDFVIFDCRETPLAMTAALARHLADRSIGIGCDQLILLEPSQIADLAMRIFNPDGSEVEACGNAARCVVSLTGAEKIATAGGVIAGAAAGSDITVTLVEPRFDWEAIPLAFAMPTDPLPMAWGSIEQPHAVNVGNPHLVFFVPDAAAIDLDTLGPQIEHDPAFPERINVNIASMTDRGIALRTFERGAGLTRACGTGACATAVAAIRSRRCASPVTVSMAGGALSIDWTPGEPVRMTGAATHVFEGSIELP